jgi:ATP-binding cassette subfamily F protein uup
MIIPAKQKLMSLIGFKDVSIGFGGPLLLNRANLQIRAGERVCLLGRNGTGKSTLMKLINGDIEADSGAVSRQQGVTVAMLTQEVPQGINGAVFEVVLDGLGEKAKLPKEYRHLSAQLAEGGSEDTLNRLDRIQEALDSNGGWEFHRRVEMLVTRMSLDPEVEFAELSAGLKRRTLLARALVCEPDVLLLDEPTNHLDIEAIAWLEEFLQRIKSTLLFVTHDRMLVRKLATRIIELDRGELSSWACDYDTYLERKEAALEAEQQHWEVFDKKLDKEEVWIRQGIKARRTRNEGRVAALLRMREQKQARQEKIGQVKLHAQEARLSGKLVIETGGLGFRYENSGQPLVHDLSTLVMRGDRVGIIGPNGCGKTTLLRLLLGKLVPQSGYVKLGTNLEINYFDQLRNQLDDTKSVQDNVVNGSDRLMVDGKTRHIIGYLQDFLFTPDRARSPAKVLSGGERNRLLLAKLFARPSNLLVLDEPTNDLDVETLELLEDLLINYKGTLLLVSHDRTFLDNVVTGTLVFEGEGKVNEYVGGYNDWLLQKPPQNGTEEQTGAKAMEKEKRKSHLQPQAQPKKLTNKEKQELQKLPGRIEELEEEQEQLYNQLADPGFYQQNKNGDRVAAYNKRLDSIKQELIQAYQRWEELEDRK